MRRCPSGFTLIELLVVLVIVAVLSGFAMNRLWAARELAFRAAMLSDLRGLVLEQDLYFGLHQTYAATMADLPEFAATEDVTVELTWSSNTGWAATATHASTADGCAIYMGEAPASAAPPATQPGVAACD